MLTHENASGGSTKSAGPLGILGAAGLALEFKHGVPAITAPFAACQSIGDALATLERMDDAQFLGLFLWLAILLASMYATMTWAVRRFKRM